MSYDGWRPVRFDDFVPGMKKNNLSILIWTALFLIDLGLILGLQYFILYPIAPPEGDILLQGYSRPDFSQAAYFEGCELLDMYGAGNYHYWVLYRNSAGENRMVCISENHVLRRYRIDKTSEQVISPDAEVSVITMDCLTHNRTFRILNGEKIDQEFQESQIKFLGSLFDGASKQMGLNMILAVVILLVEYYIYETLRKLIR